MIDSRSVWHELQANAEIETGLGERHEARRYRQINPYVEQMGGWANFSSWMATHAREYFESNHNLKASLAAEKEKVRDLSAIRESQERQRDLNDKQFEEIVSLKEKVTKLRTFNQVVSRSLFNLKNIGAVAKKYDTGERDYRASDMEYIMKIIEVLIPELEELQEGF